MKNFGALSPAGVAASLLLLGACGMEAEPEDAEDAASTATATALEIELDAAEQARLGVTLALLAAASFEERVEGPALVLDAQPIIEMLATRIAAEAAARQSQAANERAAALFGSDAAVSREVLESAQRQAAVDDAALNVARAQALVSYGSGAPWFDVARRARLVAALTAGEGVVVRATFAGEFPQATAPGALAFRRIGETAAAPNWTSMDIWFGPADPAVPGRAVFAYVEPAAGLVSGARLIASYGTGARLDGVRIPAAAVVFAGGTAWCYLAADDGVFVRTAVDLRRPLPDGYFQAEGFTADVPVVVAGAGLLLAAELGGAADED